MDNADKLAMLIKLADNDADAETLALLLDIAGDKVKRRLYPFATDRSAYEVPVIYDTLQVQVALYLYQRNGTYGLMSHTEQGVTDTFAGADIPEKFWADNGVIPYATLPSRVLNPETGSV